MIEELVDTEAQLTSLYRSATKTAYSRQHPVLVSLTCQYGSGDPLDFFSRSRSVDAPAFYWDQPDENLAIAGIGAASTIEPTTRDPFSEASRLWQEITRGALIETETDVLGSGLVAFGGFAFDSTRTSSPLWQNFPPAKFILPRFSLTSHQDHSWLTINAGVYPDTDPEAHASNMSRELAAITSKQPDHPASSKPHNLVTTSPHDLIKPEAWKELVSEAAGSIEQGGVDKIVLARALRVTLSGALQPAKVLERLHQIDRSCALFGITLNGSTFLGASPERLVRLIHGQVQVDCLAGTTRRGSTSEEDDELADLLFCNPKEQREHEVVVRVLHEQLSRFCPHINMPAQPVIRRLPSVQHLSTPLRCHVRQHPNILELAKTFHPSPAIGGFPKDVAMSFIRDREGLDRGWYGGPIGWIDRYGEGEFAVAIRSALMEQNQAHLFAGCGIMADSHPDTEFRESSMKLKSMLNALTDPSP